MEDHGQGRKDDKGGDQMMAAGICIIMAAAAALGIVAGESAALRCRAMQQVSDMLNLISEEIRCSVLPFHGVFAAVAERMDEPWSGFLEKMAEELNSYSGKSFRIIWENAVDELPPDCGLDRKDIRELKRLGMGLGYLDVQVQREAIGHFLLNWQRMIDESLSDLKPKQRMYRCLGISFGLVLVLMLV